MTLGLVITTFAEQPDSLSLSQSQLHLAAKQLYLAQFYTPEGNDSRLEERAMYIANRACFDALECIQASSNEGADLEGILRMGGKNADGDVTFFRNENLHTFLCEHYKNPQLACEPKELLLRPEGALGLIQQLAPHGNVLFTTPALLKHLRREGELLLAQR